VTLWKPSGLVLALQCVALPLLAQREGIERLFPERPTGYVTDVAGIVEPDREATITSTIERLRRATGAEIVVVTLPTIGDYDRADVALAIGRKWGVGGAAEQGDPRRNAGLVVLLVPRTDSTTGRIFISTGRGIEGIVTDAIAGRIRDRMLPSLREEKYGEALDLGVRSIASVVAQGFGVTDSTLVGEDRSIRAPRGTSRGFSTRAMLGLVLVIFVVSLLAARAQTRATRGYRGRRRRRRPNDWFIRPGGGGWGGSGGMGGFGGGSGGFAGFGGGGGFSGGGAGGDF